MRNRLAISLSIIFALSVSVFADTLCMFQGDANFLQRIFQMQINFRGNQKFTTQLKLLANNNYYFNANLEHIKVSHLDLSTSLESTGLVYKDSSGSLKSLKGWFWSNYSLLNYKPFNEMSGSFELNQKQLSLVTFSWGNILVSGNIDLISPFNLALVLEIDEMDVKELALILGLPIEDLVLEGLVKGKLKIEGNLSNLKLRGKLWASNGNIQDIKYSDIFVNLEGAYPKINIIDSGIIDEDGMAYNLEGKLDLRELNNFNSQQHSIKIYPSEEKGFNWQSWKIRRKQMFGSDDELEFEYKLKPNRPFGLRFKENQEIFGVEHKIKF
ncbi:MAG: hypothetical protein Q8O13_05945 [Candidatus Omnitrophota bacterium]|nr:hypothetical protein [Candidatus Omnitrophota bacterium]